MLRSEDPELYLEKAVHRLCDYYGKALTLEYVRNKIAWALYQTWEEFDKKSEERRMNDSCEKCLYYPVCENLHEDGCSHFAPIGIIIRCKNCKHYDTHDHRCKVWNHGVKREEFCSRGEKG